MTTKQTKAERLTSEAGRALGKIGGARNTPAQQAARVRNAQFAGRPGRVCTRCHKPVRGGHVDAGLDETCGGHTWQWSRGKAVPDARVVVTLRKIEHALATGDSPASLLRETRALLKDLES